MPTYRVFIEGKPRGVNLKRTGEISFTAAVDDKTFDVELDIDTLHEAEFSIKINGKHYQVNLPAITQEKPFQVTIEKTGFTAEVKTQKRKTVHPSFKSTHMAPSIKTPTSKQLQEGATIAPMTGRILSVMTKKGDNVKKGQVLCVLEAMKMENEITSPKKGKVQEVSISEGSSVSEGETLFIIG